MITLKEFYSPLPDIGLIAPMRSGKDEVFKIIRKLGFGVCRVAFGDAMKESFFSHFPNIPREPKPTELLQKYGQFMREFDEDVWVRPTMEHVERMIRLHEIRPSFIYTDIRQPNEYEAVKKTGAVMVKIEAPVEARVQRMLQLGETVNLRVLRAETEKILESFEYDYVIHNDGTIHDLTGEVVNLIYKLQEGKKAE